MNPYHRSTLPDWKYRLAVASYSYPRPLATQSSVSTPIIHLPQYATRISARRSKLVDRCNQPRDQWQLNFAISCENLADVMHLVIAIETIAVDDNGIYNELAVISSLNNKRIWYYATKNYTLLLKKIRKETRTKEIINKCCVKRKKKKRKKMFVRIDIKYICLFTLEPRKCRFSYEVDLITAVTCSHIMRNDRNVIYWSLPSKSKALELALSRFLTFATRKSSPQ